MADEYSNVDFEFIKAREGFEKKGYVPDLKFKHQSGVTIASGFDLGQRNEKDLKGLPDSLIEKFKPYLGLKLDKASEKLKEMPLEVSLEEADIINKFAKQKTLDKLSDQWKSATGTDFSKLDKRKATVVASVAFQYGDLPTKTENFWKQVTSDDWNAAYENLKNFGDKYNKRRNIEADYLNSFLLETYNDAQYMKNNQFEQIHKDIMESF